VIRFDYPSKTGERRIQSIADPGVLDVVRALKERSGGGHELLAWQDGADRASGAWYDVKSSDINGYIKDVTGGDFTAKDFRTWSATMLCAVAVAVSSGVAASESGRKRAVARAMREVADYLGNTPAVARSSYVDPRIVDRYRCGATIVDALADGKPEKIEAAVLDLLGDAIDERAAA